MNSKTLAWIEIITLWLLACYLFTLKEYWSAVVIYLASNYLIFSFPDEKEKGKKR